MTTAKWFTPSGRSIQKARKLLPDGEFVEVMPDSLESDSVKRARPKYKSDTGRIVYGGGGITPDIIVQADTLTTAEQKFRTALAPKGQIFATQLQEYAATLKGKLRPSFTVTPAMRADFIARLRSKGVTVDSALLANATSDLDRLMSLQIATQLFGDSTADKRFRFPEDSQLQKALSALKSAPTQQALFTLAAHEAAAQHALADKSR
jgi:carboxyl-terminal processing protease